MRKITFLILLALCAQALIAEGQPEETKGMELTIEQGDHWQEKMKVLLFSVKKTPQLAVWIEDKQGNYVSTITATSKSAKNNWKSAPKEGRPEALPVWNHKRQNSTEQIDIVSSATPKGKVDIHVDNGSLENNGKTLFARWRVHQARKVVVSLKAKYIHHEDI
jgi:hypothetical protein